TVLHSHGIKSTPFVCVLCLYFTAKLYTIILHMCLLSYYSVHIARPAAAAAEQFAYGLAVIVIAVSRLYPAAVFVTLPFSK
ncbi:MAG: hypothetical protein SOR56_06275, partial [Oscillospiraceae bacterium]|nr:hypothetical protein [Oscillospiraceae bacterium]